MGSSTRVVGSLILVFLIPVLHGCGSDCSTCPDGAGIDQVEVRPSEDSLFAVDNARDFDATARDADGNMISDVEFTWTSSNPNVATVDGQGTATAVEAGTAIIEASANGVSGTADLVVDQEIRQLSVSPSSATLPAVGDTQRFEADATDANGNPVQGVSAIWQSSDTRVITVDSGGLATAEGEGQATITATVEGTSADATVTVNNEIAGFSYSIQPSTTTAGQAINPAVEVEAVDAQGNTVTSFSGDVTVSIGTDPSGGSATLSGTTTVAASNGVAAFDDLTIKTAAAGYTLSVTTGGISSVESDSFDIEHGAASKLGYATQPSDASAGDAISPVVEVEARDEYGNAATSFSGDVTVSIGTDPSGGSATLSGTTTVAASNGVATFADLTIETAETGYTLAAATSGLTGTTSDAFEIRPGSPAQLAYVTQPSDTEGRELISPAVEVEVVDDYGNRVTSSSASITVTLAHDPTTGDALGGGASLSGTTTVSASNGLATFGDLSLGRPGSRFTLEATTGGLPSAVSEGFDIQLTFVQVSAGNHHACGVTTDNHAFCWGTNNGGALGDGTVTDRSRPVAVAGGHAFVRVSAGAFHTCGLTTADELYCWGDNSNGELGDGTTTDRPTPVTVDVSALSTPTFAQVSAGFAHTCGVTTDQVAFCWGRNADGQLGDGTTTDRSTPRAVNVSGLTTPTFARVSAGGYHTCGVTTADKPYCWGANYTNQLGEGTTTDRSSPAAVDVSGLATKTFARVSAGNQHTCGLTTADEPYCWGDNFTGQLGDGTTTDRSSPVTVDVSDLATGTFVRITTGGGHTCGLTTVDEAYCWGSNTEGQLGDGTTTERTTPVAVDVSGLTAGTFAGISTGSLYTCGLTTADEPVCWGSNASGQLGEGTTTDSSMPVRVFH